MTDRSARPDDSNSRIVQTLRALLADEQARGAEIRDVGDYQKMFAGHEELVATEYARFLTPDRDEPRTHVGTDGDDTESAAAAFRSLGPYEIVRRLGRGGQGEVFLARDTRLGRSVALKVLGEFNRQTLSRFRREAEVASRLDHPGICTIYDSGQFDGRYFIAMRFVDGEPLSQQIQNARDGIAPSRDDVVQIPSPPVGSTQRDGTGTGTGSTHSTRRPLERTLRYFEHVARAVHAAHEAGLVHRDIKPSNLMVTCDGAPVVLDFGMARDVETRDGADLTAASAVLGTPDYMSPEQLDPRRAATTAAAVDQRTDVYSLGVSLFECLTLHRPFAAPSWAEQFRRILEDDLPHPGRLNPAVGPELRAVLEMAVEKDPDRRYATAVALADELRRILENEPVLARPVGPLVRIGKWARRQPVLAATVAGLLVTVVVLGFALVKLRSTYGSLRDQQVARAEAERRAATEAYTAYRNGELLLTQGAWSQAETEFARALELGHPDLALVALARADALDGAGDRTASLAILRTLDVSPGAPHRGQVLLALADRLPATSPEDGLQLFRDAIATGMLDPADEAFARAMVADSIDETRTQLERAITLDRYHRRANESWGLVLLNTGEFAAAEQFGRTYETLYPNDPTGFLIRAVATHRLDGSAAFAAFVAQRDDGADSPANASTARQRLDDMVGFIQTFDVFRTLEPHLLSALGAAAPGRSRPERARVGSSRLPRMQRRLLERARSESVDEFLVRVLPLVGPRIVDGMLRSRDAIGNRLPYSLSSAWQTFKAAFFQLGLGTAEFATVEAAMTDAIGHVPDGAFHLVRGCVRLIRENVAGAVADFEAAERLGSLFNIRTVAPLLTIHARSVQWSDAAPESAERTDAATRLGATARRLLGTDDAGSPALAWALGWVRLVGDRGTAEAVAEEWCRRAPANPRTWIARAELAREAGHLYLAKDLVERALALAPTSRRARSCAVAIEAALARTR